MSESSAVADAHSRLATQFHYRFNEDGKLVHVDTGEGFKSVSQEDYEAVGECVLEYIQERMVTEYGLVKTLIPVGANEETDPACDIYLSEDVATNENMLILIQGCGAVRAGQWARSCCINDTLRSGSIFPCLDQAKELGWSVVVMNPNKVTVKNKHVPGASTSEEHACYVWENFVAPSSAKQIYVIAHSYGGQCTMALLSSPFTYEDVLRRVVAIAFTDSAHSLGRQELPSASGDFLKTRCRNWVASSLPRDTRVQEVDSYAGMPCVSAGHTRHEYTTGSAFPSIFPFFEKMTQERQ